MRPSRRGLFALATAGSLTLLSACAAFSPTTTELNYSPADGVPAQLGSVVARNLLVVGDKGKDGLLSGALANEGTEDSSLTIQVKGQAQPVTVDVPSNGLVQLGSGDNQTAVVVGSLSVGPGQLVQVTLSSPKDGQTVVDVPVLAPSGYYSTVTPTAD